MLHANGCRFSVGRRRRRSGSPQEFPGAFHLDRGMLEFWVDPASEYYRDLFTPDKRYILYCAGGGRSALSAKTMKDMGYPNVAHLESGFSGWDAAGMPKEDCKTGAKWVLRADVEQKG